MNTGEAQITCDSCGRRWLMPFALPEGWRVWTAKITGIRCVDCEDRIKAIIGRSPEEKLARMREWLASPGGQACVAEVNAINAAARETA